MNTGETAPQIIPPGGPGIRIKILFSVLLCLCATISVNALFLVRYQNKNSERAEQDVLLQYYAAYLDEIEAQQKTAAGLSTTLADRPDLVEPLLARNRPLLQQNLDPVFQRMKHVFRVTHFYIHQPDGYIFLRLHDPKQYGDAFVSYRQTILDAMRENQTVAGVEVDANRLGMRGISPIISGGKTSGFVEIGLDYDRQFLLDLHKRTGADYNLWITYAAAAPSGLWPSADQASSPNPAIFHYAGNGKARGLASSALYQAALQSGRPQMQFARHDGLDLAVLIAPLPGYKGQMIGLIEIIRPRNEAIAKLNQQQQVTMLAAGLVALLALVIIWFVLNLLVIRPLSRLNEAAQRQLQGDLSFRATGLPDDEYGQLGKTFNHLSDDLEQSLGEREQNIQRLQRTEEELRQSLAEQQRAEQALRESEERFRTTLLSIGDAVIATDMEGLVQQLNPAAEKITGWSTADAAGWPLEKIFKTIDATTRQPLPTPFRLTVERGKPANLEGQILLLSRNGFECIIDDSSAPIFDRNGQMTGIVIIFRDVTESRRLEEQLHQAQKMDVVGQLAGGIAHDFNNMLGGILGYADLLTTDLKRGTPPHDYALAIVDGARHAADLTQKLLAFSRKGKVVSISVDLHGAIRNVIGLIERSIDRRIQITTCLQAKNPWVVGDPGLLQSALLNLAVNARDAMPDGGELAFITQNNACDKQICLNLPPGFSTNESILIIVRDSGIGISKDILPHIFEPFFTTKQVGKGTGLGLAAVYGTVKDHHGCIDVESTPGSGTAIKIYLPVETPSQPPPAAQQEPLQCGRGCILVIDDEPLIRGMVQAMLQTLGYSVLLARDGEEGVEVYRREAERIHLVLLDMIMPRLNGREAFLRIKALNPHAKIIFSSGFSRDGNMNDLFAKGASGFIQKPYQMAALSRIVAETLEND